MLNNAFINVQALPVYYADSIAHWYKKSKLLWVKISATVDGKCAATPFHLSVDASNITQIALDLSLTKEILALEVIGAQWSNTPSLTEPTIWEHRNLSVSLDNWLPLAPLSKSKNFYVDYERALILETNPDQTLFRICLNEHGAVASNYISASPHIIYGITNGVLQEIWIVSPEEELLQ